MRRRLQRAHWTTEAASQVTEVTVGGVLRAAAARWGDKAALIEGSGAADSRSWTFAELACVAQEVARALLTRFEPGDRVAVWSTNNPEWVHLQFGAALAGMTLVTVNPAYGHAEVEFVLRHSRARGVFVEPMVRSRDLLGIARDVSSGIPVCTR